MSAETTAPPVDDALLAELQAAGADSLPAPLARRVRRLHAAEVADLVEALPGERRPAIWRALGPAARGELLVQLRGEVRRRMIDAAGPDELRAALGALQLDELADLYPELPDPVAAALRDGLAPADRERFDLLRGYAPDCAGGLMDTDALAVDSALELADVTARLREVRRRRGALPEHFDSVFVVDGGHRYVGVLPLAELVSLGPEARIGDVLRRPEPIAVDLPARQVARLFEDRDLLSAPVVDAAGRLLGRITVDDVVDVIRGEGEDAVLALAGGLDRDVDLFGAPLKAARRRSIWLGVHLVNALVAAWVIGRFAGSIEQLVALAVLMPVVAGIGGVGGTQSLALVMRGLALDRVRLANGPRLVVNELAIALVNGLLLAATVGLGVWFWFDAPGLATVFALALLLNLLNGALAGTWLPLLLNRVGIDPALAGGVLLVAVTDIIGFALFLGLATAVLL